MSNGIQAQVSNVSLREVSLVLALIFCFKFKNTKNKTFQDHLLLSQP